MRVFPLDEKPLTTSLTGVCAPKPIAIPTIPAAAINGATRAPVSCSTITTAVTHTVTSRTACRMPASVLARCSRELPASSGPAMRRSRRPITNRHATVMAMPTAVIQTIATTSLAR